MPKQNKKKEVKKFRRIVDTSNVDGFYYFLIVISILFFMLIGISYLAGVRLYIENPFGYGFAIGVFIISFLSGLLGHFSSRKVYWEEIK
ncbi:hypothetical protein M0R04_14750 [Candidatus Dojkabacteria bacterium]|jgi:hypothetical protein|nr:hypothetical protein [Candidatus Dojkabacteria bacterium]